MSDALALASKGYITIKNAKDVGLAMDDAVSQTRIAVTEVTNLAQSLQEGAGPQIDSALNEAQILMDNIKILLPNMTEKNDESKAALNKSVELRTKMAQIVLPLGTIDQSLKSLKNKTNTFKDNIADIKIYTDIVRIKAEEINSITNANRYVKDCCFKY